MSKFKIKTGKAEEKLQNLVRRIEKIRNHNEIDQIVRESQQIYGVKHISFAGFNLDGSTKDEPINYWTYKPEWIDHYRKKNYLQIDPVVKSVPLSMLPVDWAQFDRKDKAVRNFFNEAQDADVGTTGLSIPVRGREKDFSVLSLTFDASQKDWLSFKTEFMQEFQILAMFFHQSLLRTQKSNLPHFDLTDRELEILYWAACGKTNQETAIILGVSKRTVRFHCSHILLKLNAANIAHAVGKAIYFEIIKPPL